MMKRKVLRCLIPTYKYTLVILFKSGNLWEVGVPSKDLAIEFARLLVQRSQVEILSIIDNKTGRLKLLNTRKFLN